MIQLINKHIINVNFFHSIYLEKSERYLSDDEYETITGQISLLKNLMIAPNQTKEIQKYVENEVELFIQIYKTYEQKKKHITGLTMTIY